MQWASIFLLILGYCFNIYGYDDLNSITLEQKIQGFEDFENQNKVFNNNRESDLNTALKEKKENADERERLLSEYLKQQAKIKFQKPEDSQDFKDYLKQKNAWKNSLESAANESRKSKENFKSGSKKNRIFEIREYALQSSEKNRIPYNRRQAVTKKSSTGSTSSGGFSSGGGFNSGGGGGGSPYIPPPPIEDGPDFDNDIPPPPPPPPPMGGGDFDEVDPIQIPPPPM